MTARELTRRFPHASGDFIARNATIQAEDSGKAPLVECLTRDASLGTVQSKEARAGKIHCRFTDVRKRACDPDNLSIKWTLDALRYIGCLRDDTAKDVTVEVRQRRCLRGEAEATIVELWRVA